LNKTLDSLKHIKDVESAKECLFQLCGKNKGIKEALLFAKKAHQEQYRKSGEPYIIHPILVAVIVKLIGGDDEMVISALLHDTVEDTDVTIEDIENKFGKNIKSIVDGLTKITEIREEELLSSSSNKKLISSALTFRKMLISSIEDVRVLVIKLCDRVHNMLTLDALSKQKQKRITEETLVVYVPIAHRLGIGKIKNFLEDRCFYYLFPIGYLHNLYM
jgi:(p)ppGpp synthase/HD superfamily hydrolase